ncbi:unnamed protein product [Ranitomeya imitator]|uniref:Uncharacterized protein n=1 Tax=Ranitomeya imitator TaxID=111125 RepID=A0ABN9MF85_9NEOB|nr:unnamed protein product [Ranitomeya imitator]
MSPCEFPSRTYDGGRGLEARCLAGRFADSGVEVARVGENEQSESVGESDAGPGVYGDAAGSRAVPERSSLPDRTQLTTSRFPPYRKSTALE